MIEPTQKPSVVRTPEGIDVHLPFSWLSEIWARGLAITGARLCLAADTNNGPGWTLATLDRDLSQPTQLTIATLQTTATTAAIDLTHPPTQAPPAPAINARHWPVRRGSSLMLSLQIKRPRM